jgi:type IV pilus assembly protein PilC
MTNDCYNITMSMFEYKAQVISTGEEASGTLDAKDKFELSRKLKEDGKMLFSAKEIKGLGSFVEKVNTYLAKIELRDKILFANNLATMIQAGLPLSRALSIILKQTQNLKLKQILKDISENINKGMTLSDSLAKYPKVFPSVFIYMVKAGEESGGLVESLQVVGGQMEKTYTLQKKVKGAMMYPAVITCVMIGVAVLMMLYVVPGLAQTFAEANVQLPFVTKIFVNTSYFLQNHYFIALGAFGVIVGIILILKNSKKGQRILDFVSMRLPVFGLLVKEYNAAAVTRTLSSLISSGVDIVRSIDITHDVVTNVYYKETLVAARESVQKGVPLSQTFINNSKIYPVMVGDMMEVGEETGQLSPMLKKIAMFYESEVDQTTADMSKLMEPLLMVMIASFVGLFAVAMITPMYSIMNNV